MRPTLGLTGLLRALRGPDLHRHRSRPRQARARPLPPCRARDGLHAGGVRRRSKTPPPASRPPAPPRCACCTTAWPSPTCASCQGCCDSRGADGRRPGARDRGGDPLPAPALGPPAARVSRAAIPARTRAASDRRAVLARGPARQRAREPARPAAALRGGDRRPPDRGARDRRAGRRRGRPGGRRRAVAWLCRGLGARGARAAPGPARGRAGRARLAPHHEALALLRRRAALAAWTSPPTAS